MLRRVLLFFALSFLAYGQTFDLACPPTFQPVPGRVTQNSITGRLRANECADPVTGEAQYNAGLLTSYTVKEALFVAKDINGSGSTSLNNAFMGFGFSWQFLPALTPVFLPKTAGNLGQYTGLSISAFDTATNSSRILVENQLTGNAIFGTVASLNSKPSLTVLAKLRATPGRYWIGWVNDVGPSTADFDVDAPLIQVLGFRASSFAPDTTWKCYMGDNSPPPTIIDSLVTVDTTVHVFSVRFDGANVNWFIDRTLVCSTPYATGQFAIGQKAVVIEAGNNGVNVAACTAACMAIGYVIHKQEGLLNQPF